MKLESVGMHSICVILKDAKLVEIVEKGAYRFGDRVPFSSQDISML